MAHWHDDLDVEFLSHMIPCTHKCKLMPRLCYIVIFSVPKSIPLHSMLSTLHFIHPPFIPDYMYVTLCIANKDLLRSQLVVPATIELCSLCYQSLYNIPTIFVHLIHTYLILLQAGVLHHSFKKKNDFYINTCIINYELQPVKQYYYFHNASENPEDCDLTPLG